KYRKFKPTENKHKYALCVPARNEEKVIKNFLESVAHQDYPLDKLTVFVVADNCTDNTANIEREFKENGLKVVVYEHYNPDERTKGFALRYLFDVIERDYGRENFEGYFIFDADNVINQNYITKMNEAFEEGNKIIVSFRNSKNLNQNWISFGYAMHWLRTCLTESRGKSVLKQACRVQGTGILFANELVKDGWIHTGLTEDRAFCTDAVVKNYKLSYCDEAIFYDEQPCKLKVALRQRLRWAKGHLQTTLQYSPKLLRNIFRKGSNFFTSYDMFWINFPSAIESASRKIIKRLLQVSIAIATYSVGGLVWSLFTAWILGHFFDWLEKMGVSLLIMFKFRKRIEFASFWKTVGHILMFPFFDIIGRWSSYVALFKKVEWKPIPHDTVVDVKKLK
ncbi:MAG: glycosyltransferase family 2 protein, partial [Clostridia bacterium]|nr:glycosyltransferase family 2 protein [Clostridia bacterium]